MLLLHCTLLRMLLLLPVLLFLPAAVCGGAAGPRSTPSSFALRYAGYTESGENRGEFVDYINLKVGAPLGSPYCASFVYFVLDSVGWGPRIKTAWSRSYVRYGVSVQFCESFNAEGLLVWKRKNGGHIGFIVRSVGKFQWETIEANTSSGKFGSQYNGNGIWKRVRSYEPFNSVFRITHIVRLSKSGKVG